MKCISCETEINPKWKHAIDQNICPFCGSSIMEELLKGLLSTLRETMEKLQDYPDQVNDWLLSNYNYIKTDSPDLKNFVPVDVLKNLVKEVKREVDGEDFERKKSVIKIKTERGEEEVVTEKIQSDSRTAEFFKRAEALRQQARADDGDFDPGDVDAVVDTPAITAVKKQQRSPNFKSIAEKTAYLKSVKKKIESGEGQAIIGETGLATMIDSENLENVDGGLAAEYQSMIGSGDIITSALPPPSGGDDDFMTEQVLAANLAIKGNSKKSANSGEYNEADVRSLQNMYGKVQKSREAFENGDNRAKKGGFSRV